MILKSLTASDNQITKEYKITARPDVLNKIELTLHIMETLGRVGSSRRIEILWDGDGMAQMNIDGLDSDIAKVDISEIENLDSPTAFNISVE